MSALLTAVFREVPEGFVGWVEGIPGANVQEATLAEAVELVLAANRELAWDDRGELSYGDVRRSEPS